MVWRCLEYLLIDGVCLRQSPGLVVRQRGLQSLNVSGCIRMLSCRMSFITPLATLFIFLAAIARARIVATSFAHIILGFNVPLLPKLCTLTLI